MLPELMILGFISLLLTIGKETISDICIPSKVARTWHPCNEDKPDDSFYDPCLKKVYIYVNFYMHIRVVAHLFTSLCRINPTTTYL